MKLSEINRKKYALKILVYVLVGMLAMPVGGLPVAEAASCMDIADIPLESMEEEGPGLIMFVVDDSGSMDWSTMIDPLKESNGIFDNNYEYVFSNPGDDIYSTWNSVEDAGTDIKMKWMSQWSGYNGMYYDPTVEYTPWPWPDNTPPFESPANVDSPRSNPMVNDDTKRFDLSTNGTDWHTWDDEVGVLVDNGGTGYADSGNWGLANNINAVNDSYRYSNGGTATYWATWTATGLDPDTTYTVEASWYNNSANREDSVAYRVFDDNSELTESPSPGMDQSDTNTWYYDDNPRFNTLLEGVTFSSGIGVVRLEMDSISGGLCADAVRFVPEGKNFSNIARRHYYVRSGDDVYLVNITDQIEYYKVDLTNIDDNDEVVTAEKLTRVTSPPADISTDWDGNPLDYDKVCQNFANWYSFYRRRELTAKNAIGNVINTIEGVFVGIISINENIDEQILKPVRVNLDGTTEDKSEELLTALYNLNSFGSTPLRNGLKMAGEYFKGNHLKPPSSDYIKQDDYSYPYFTEDEGGSCQQAFTVLFTDGYYNGSSPGVGNEDGNNDSDYDGGDLGDDESDTLADVAMRYYEDDLKSDTYLEDNLSVSLEDPATHQHMVTYTVAFGVTGELDSDLYADCPLGACPSSWPEIDSDVHKIDDMFHAAVNGRGAFIAASNSEELNEALAALQSNIENRLGASAALATNSIQLSVGSVIYQGTYNTSSWFGEVSALSLDVISGVVSETPIWQASDELPDENDRTILSFANGAGVVFEAGNLTTAQKELLVADAPTGVTDAADVVDYIRGDTSKSVESGGLMRNRSHPLGDIVHSAPTYYKGMVYIGANDGMLHGFDSSTGVEKFAYVPGMVYDNLGELSNPNYIHNYYVDNTAAVARVGSRDVLVCGLGKGGKGYFGLDVTQPGAMEAADVLWEFTDSDMGYSFSKAFIVNTKAAGDVVIFGNGYDTADGNGHAILFVLDALTGTVLKRFDTGIGSVTDCNGMSTPAPVDVELDGYVDYVYAGDLKGNMWKIDLRDADTDNWAFAFKNGSTPMPLITVRNENGDVQPITAPPEVMLDGNQVEEEDVRGLMVIFGTGKYLHYTDFNDTTVQSFYGIWDQSPIWEDTDSLTVARGKYLGTFGADRSLSNMGSGITLLEQEFIYKDSEWGVLTDNQPDWYNPFAASPSGIHMGWNIDLPISGERSLLQPTLNAGAAILISTIPSGSPCEAGGSSGTYIVSAITGGRYPYPAYDVNDDGTIDDNDTVEVNGVPIFPQWHPDPKIIYDLLIISGEAYRQDAQGNIEQFDTVENMPGMFFWRVIGQ
jgi:type IV pilus assembly protein PilY1